MRAKHKMIAAVLGALLLCLPLAAVQWQSEVLAGTRFMVELRDRLEGKKHRPGKRFDARTLEALRVTDGSVIAAGAKFHGRVAYAEDNKMILRFEEIDTRRGWVPIVATVTGAIGEKHVKNTAGREGELSASGGRDLVLEKGARIELVLDRPLVFIPRR